MSNRIGSAQSLRIISLYNGKITQNEDDKILINSQNQQQILFVRFYGVITVKDADSNLEANNGKTFSALLDDGTGSVWMRITADLFEKIDTWEFVRVIGIIKIEKYEENSNSITLYPEAVIPVKEKIWELIHILDCDRSLTLEIPRDHNKDNQIITSPKFDGSNFKPSTESLRQNSIKLKEETQSKNSNAHINESLTEKIEKILKEMDLGEGVEFNQLLKALGNNYDESVIDDILFELAYEGKVYQPRPEYYKLMD